MFGAIAYFINGNMFAGAHQDELFLRLSATDRQAIMQEYDEVSAFEPMPGRPMTEYVTLPESVYSQPGMLSEWLDRCRRYAALIAPKTGKKQNKKPGK